jgi:hypothetical protein
MRRARIAWSGARAGAGAASPCAALLACLAGAFLLQGAAVSAAPCADAACAATALRDHPATGIAFWRAGLERPIAQRVDVAPEELVSYLKLDNLAAGIAEVPRSAVPDATFLRDLRQAFDGIPAAVKRLVDRRLAGIRLVRGLGSTGYTEAIRDGKGAPVAGFIVLDIGALEGRRANAWATWKENTPFAADGLHTLEAVIAKRAGDTRAAAMRYILLHELGHIASIGAGLHPHWGMSPADAPALAQFRFARLSWVHEPGAMRYGTRFDAAFSARADLAYYSDRRLPAARMDAAYAWLATTDFPSLYAATGPGDDFAESFASYVHTVLLRQPWQVEIFAGGRRLRRLDACWEKPRCAAKRELLDQLLDAGR